MVEIIKDYFKKLFKEKVIFLLLGIIIGIGILTKLEPNGILGEDAIYSMLGGDTRNPVLFKISNIFAIIGSWKVLIPTTLLVMIGSYIKDRRDLFIGFFISCFGGFFVNAVIKNIFLRPRPIHILVDQSGYSYPSGHAMVNSAVYLFIAYYLSEYVDSKHKTIYYVLAALLSLMMAASRVYLGVHYISDVVAGLIGGFMVLLGVIFTLEYIRSIDKADY